MNGILVDTGPLLAYLDRSDRDHSWAKETFMQLTRPSLTCEAVIAEALFLLRRAGIDPDGLLNLTSRGWCCRSLRSRQRSRRFNN